MPSTDPIADLFAALHNASVAYLDSARVADSRFKQSVLKTLQAEGFIKSFQLAGDKSGRKKLEVHLAYGPKRERLLNGVKRMSKPGRRVYISLADIKPYLRRLEVPLLSTPQGILTGAQAFARKTGGELLALVW